MSETVSIDEVAGGYMEMLEYINSARGHLMALEDKSSMEGYLETMMQGTTLKQKACATLVLSEMHAETIEQLMSLPWRAVVLRYFEEEMRTTPKIHALIAIPYVRTELQLRFAWCMIGLTRGNMIWKKRKGVLNDECEGSDDPKRSSSRVRETERRSLIRSISDRTKLSASI